MADSNDVQTADASTDDESTYEEATEAEAPATPSRGGASGRPAMRGAAGVLRDAIQKVTEEIEQHEREAKRHSQQAKDLRAELRESFSFLLGQGGKEKAAAAERRAEVTPPESAGTAAEETPAGKRPKAEGKKKAPGRKGKRK